MSSGLYSKHLYHPQAKYSTGDPIPFLAAVTGGVSSTKDPLPARSTFKGKQFSSTVPKQVRAAQEGLFGKLAYAAHPYEDSNGYLKSFPLDQRKLGFYSHQPPNRDQFSKTLTTQQYRESIRRETRSTDAAIAAAAAAEEERADEEGVAAAIGADSTRAGVPGGGDGSRRHLYDLVHGSPDHKPDWQKTARDVTFSIKTRPKEVPRRTGEHVVSSAAYGVGAGEVERPTHVRLSVKREFYHSGHVADIGSNA